MLLGHVRDRTNVGIAVANNRLRVFRCQIVQPDLNLERAQLAQRNLAESDPRGSA